MVDPTSRGPWLEQRVDDWIVRILVGDEPLAGLVDVEAVAPDGRRLVGTLGALQALVDLMADYRSSGECLSGSYFWTKNLVILSEMTAPAALAAISDLIASGEVWAALEVILPADNAVTGTVGNDD